MKKTILLAATFGIFVLAIAYAQEKNSPAQPMEEGNDQQFQGKMMDTDGMMGAGPMMAFAGVAGERPMMGRGPMAGERPMMGERGERPMMEQGFMERGMGHEGGKAAIYLRQQEDLKLTDDQVKKLKDIRVAFRKDMIDKQAKLATGRLELEQLLDGDNPDMSSVEKKVRANHEIDADIVIATIRTNKAADAVLTADQLKTAKKMTPGFQRDRQGKRMGPMGQRPGRNMKQDEPQEKETNR